MLEMIMELSSSIINSTVINAVLDLSAALVLVVLLSVLLVLVLTNSVSSILLLVKNSILSKAIVRVTDKVRSFRYIEAYWRRRYQLQCTRDTLKACQGKLNAALVLVGAHKKAEGIL